MNHTKQFIGDAIAGGKRDYMRKPQSWRPVPLDMGGGYVCEIESKGQYFFPRVDSEDQSRIGAYRWYLKDGYAVTSIKGKRVKMHHPVLGKPPEGKVTDHIDRDRLNNQKSNLHFVTPQENKFNVRAQGYRKCGKKWDAQIQRGGKQIHLGTFTSELVARNAYLSAKEVHHVI